MPPQVIEDDLDGFVVVRHTSCVRATTDSPAPAALACAAVTPTNNACRGDMQPDDHVEFESDDSGSEGSFSFSESSGDDLPAGLHRRRHGLRGGRRKRRGVLHDVLPTLSPVVRRGRGDASTAWCHGGDGGHSDGGDGGDGGIEGDGPRTPAGDRRRHKRSRIVRDDSVFAAGDRRVVATDDERFARFAAWRRASSCLPLSLPRGGSAVVAAPVVDAAGAPCRVDAAACPPLPSTATTTPPRSGVATDALMRFVRSASAVPSGTGVGVVLQRDGGADTTATPAVASTAVATLPAAAGDDSGGNAGLQRSYTVMGPFRGACVGPPTPKNGPACPVLHSGVQAPPAAASPQPARGVQALSAFAYGGSVGSVGGGRASLGGGAPHRSAAVSALRPAVALHSRFFANAPR